MDDSNSKRRRGLGLVTPNACTECRKKRTKCDGQIPCARCASLKGVECVYEVPVRQSKEEMRTEIERLRAQQQLNGRVLAALVSSDESEQVLDQLRGGETLESITGKLDIGKSTPSTSALQSARSIASSPYSALAFSDTYSDASRSNQTRSGSWPEWGGESSMSRQVADPNPDTMRWNPEASQASPHLPGFAQGDTWHQQLRGQTPRDATAEIMSRGGRETFLGTESIRNLQGPDYTEPWTTVTDDINLIEHLMALYFCWEYPTFAPLDQGNFLEDFRKGVPRFCSSLLVNAMLAVGCRLSTHYAARADPNDTTSAGDHFFADAVRIFQQQTDHHHLTTIQALGLMSIREASRGHTSNSLYYSGQAIRLAIEMGLHISKDSDGDDQVSPESTVRRATFWGAFALDQCWSLSIGQLPYTSRHMKLPAKPHILDQIEASPWIPYIDDDTQLESPPLGRSYTQPSNVQSVYKTFCELSEIVYGSSYALYTPGETVTSKSLLRVYTKYLRWYDSIPAVLRLGHNFTPAVLFCHMYYHYAILLLFRPFIKLDIVGSGVSPRDVCHQAAQAISTLVTSYDQLYTLRRTPSFVPYFTLTSTITHLVALGNRQAGAERFHQGMSHLRVMDQCHGFAVRARQILSFLCNQWHVEVVFERSTDEEYPKVVCRPRSTSGNHWAMNIHPGDIVTSIGPIRGPDDSPLFWPFPFQGRPFIEDGEMLEKSGFKILER